MPLSKPLSNAERQKRWRDRHGKSTEFGKRTRREITMEDIVKLLEDAPPFHQLPKWRVYSMLNAQRDIEKWFQLWVTIRFNEDGKSAPVQVIGSGRKGDPYTFRLSEEYDESGLSLAAVSPGDPQ